MNSKRLNRSAVSAGISGLIVIVIVAVIFATYVGFTFSQSTSTTSTLPFPVTTVNETSTISYQTSTVYQIPTQSASDTNSTLGISLELKIVLSNDSGWPVISAQVLNIKNVQNNVSAADEWRYPSDSLNPFSPCGAIGPLGFAVFQGYYNLSNFSSANALTLYNSNVSYTCTTISSPIVYFIFNASSNFASPYSSNGPQYPSIGGVPMSVDYMTSGYWTGSVYQSDAEYHYFSPGTYTVIAADEWGGLVILHFVVTQGIATIPISTISSTAYISVCSSITTTILNYTSILTVTECK